MEITGQAEQEKRLLSIMVQGVGENGENGWKTMTGCTSGFVLEIIEVDSGLIGDADLREVEAILGTDLVLGIRWGARSTQRSALRW